MSRPGCCDEARSSSSCALAGAALQSAVPEARSIGGVVRALTASRAARQPPDASRAVESAAADCARSAVGPA
jgi:hypothetical protein